MDAKTLEILSKFFEVFLTALLPVVAAFLVRWLKVKGDLVLEEIKESAPDLAYTLEFIAGIAVKAAEQANVAGLVKDKKSYAIKIAEKYLDSKGITADLDVISAAIEAAVLDEFNHPDKVAMRAKC